MSNCSKSKKWRNSVDERVEEGECKMEREYRFQTVVGISIVLGLWAYSASGKAVSNESSKYLDAVREFADNVLKYGRDTYGPNIPRYL